MIFNPKNFSEKIIASSEISDGNMALSDSSCKANIEKFLAKIKVSEKYAYCQQTHFNKIKIINNPGYYEDCDGLIGKVDFPLFVRSADCIPVLISESESGVLGAIHVGWRSLFSGIVRNSLKETLEKLNIDVKKIKVFIGPSIGVINYEVKQEFLDYAAELGYSRFSNVQYGKYFFDLKNALLAELEQIGIREDNIDESGIDNFEDPRFYSYRRDFSGTYETFITVISKK